MGCGASSDAGSPGAASPAQTAINQKIDDELQIAQQAEEQKIKLLLLGAGESGKSTIFKQMRIIYGTPRTDDNLRMFGVVIRSNCITVTRKLCQVIRLLEVEDDLEEEPAAEGADMTPFEAFELLASHLIDGTGPPLEPIDLSDDWVGHCATAGLGPNNDAQVFLQIWKPIKSLWSSKLIKKEVWQQRMLVNIIDGHKDFLDAVDRIASKTFKPTQQDVLLARVKTTQVVMERYRIDGIDFEMYDVGGQRSERRKWIDCFDSVDAVIFVAALSEYDQNLAEAKRTNRMVEALELFRSICNNRAFANTSVMLFLNKKDIFEEKLQYSDIAAQKPFSDYGGPPKDFNNGVLYFIEKFKECLINDEITDSFIQACTATDTNNMEFVLDSTRTIIMTDNLRRSGFLGAGQEEVPRTIGTSNQGMIPTGRKPTPDQLFTRGPTHGHTISTSVQVNEFSMGFCNPQVAILQQDMEQSSVSSSKSDFSESAISVSESRPVNLYYCSYVRWARWY